MFFQIDIKEWFALEGFEVLKDKQEKPLRKSKWTKEQVKKFKTYDKVTKILIDLLPNDILYKLGKYNDISKL